PRAHCARCGRSDAHPRQRVRAHAAGALEDARHRAAPAAGRLARGRLADVALALPLALDFAVAARRAITPADAAATITHGRKSRPAGWAHSGSDPLSGSTRSVRVHWVKVRIHGDTSI